MEPSPPPEKAKRKLLGVIKVIDSRERDRSVPAPWAYRWSWRIFVVCAVVYSYYVMIGRLCAPMLQRRSDARGSVGQGAGLLIGETILFLMFCWTYLKAISTSPGIAPEVIPRSEPPPTYHPDQQPSTNASSANHHNHLSDDTEDDLNLAGNAGPLDGGRNLLPAEFSLPGFMDSSASASASPPFASYGTQRGGNGNGIAEAEGNRDTGRISSSLNLGYGYGNGNEMNLVGSRESGIPLTSPGQHRQGQGQGQEQGQRSGQTNYTHTVWGDGNPTETDQSRTDLPQAQGEPGSQAQFQDQAPSRPFPPDQKEQAYCSYCQIYKPWRSHHCRVCGVCVLGMDHDCPWVGCIGWRNHKFFINFLTWSTIYTIYVFVVLVCKLSQGGSADGQMIGIAALSGFFTLFTASMLLSHMQLIAVGMTTIESFSMRSQLDRERAFLTRQFGVCGWTRKRKAMKTWGREWGDLKDEGNRWFLGPGPYDEWKRVMGDSPVGWILPVGRSKGDGIHFPQNPRFAPDGTRRRRQDWPAELQ
ncbi:hypothetical protein FFLO_05801 [Filobasidium floriforme]|uniref:Palmitoyltransferase n=1 Tax=Filobasidium floriforme TaxID=5210 RepID=A0A8K0JG45_9TREE|nr:DHHC palmitoyltransferase-domain-containing protein [Filobasidium floriforme]KAG7529039.1 hypothetical protein FFLO_05801 [Filobasidium floriforme]KAH8078688.1 DHHC palmitoyltransferase-domain-containing protein [Filobasidium floriforme]